MTITPLLSPEEAYFEQFSGEDEPEYHWTMSHYESALCEIGHTKWKQMYECQWQPASHFIVAPNELIFKRYCKAINIAPYEAYHIDRLEKVAGLQNVEVTIVCGDSSAQYRFPEDKKAVIAALEEQAQIRQLKLDWIDEWVVKPQ